MAQAFLVVATALQGVAIGYGVYLLRRRGGATGAWSCLLGAMVTMLAWRLFVLSGVESPAYFNPLIATCGSTCMLAAMVLFAREVARRERAEAERDALLSSERHARTEAERAIRLRDDFLATLSHELRTPLAAILGWCAVLRHTRTGTPESARGLDTIERNARAQARLVDELLDATRIQAGTLQMDPAPIRLDGPVQAAVDAVRPAAAAKGVSLHLICEAAAPIVNGDAGRLQQVASNLLANAVKFTPAGGAIQVRIAVPGDQVTLVVADTGEGIDREFLPHVFDRFRQADSTVARRHGGLGLGLAIVSSLCALHGGRVSAESDGLGTGATFTVTLPLATDQLPRDPSLVLTSDASVAIPADALADLRLLLVDDEPDVRAAVSQILEQLGAEVVALESGAAIEATLLGFDPHLLLLDVGMPGEDGYSLIRRIRRLPARQGGAVPAVSLTAHAREEDRSRAIASGFQEHLPKPLDVARLVAAIRTLAAPRLQERAQAQARASS